VFYKAQMSQSSTPPAAPAAPGDLVPMPTMRPAILARRHAVSAEHYLASSWSTHESRLGDVLDGLAERGHRVSVWPAYTPSAGSVCAIAADRDKDLITAAADVRRVSYAIGW
jgi:gamma-glutamyltranspeptidase